MSATITWRVTELGVENKIVDGHDDMVSIVYWECAGTEDINGNTYTASLSRNTVIPYDPTHHYVPFADMTEAEALEWVFEQDSVKANTEAEIQAMLDAQATPPILTPALPWAN
jgi:hypothetical protein